MLVLRLVALAVTTSSLFLATADSKSQPCACYEVNKGSEEAVTVCHSTTCIPRGRAALKLLGPGVTSLTREALRADHHLRSLSIESPSLAALPGNLLVDARNLRRLEISFCPSLKELPEELLQPTSGSLEELVLRNLTGLSQIPGKFLALANPRLRRLVLHNLPGLTELNLNLHRFGTSLQELVVSGTSLEKLDLRGIPAAAALTSLDLSRNHLRELPILADFLEKSRNLEKLSLSGNRWDCSLLWQQGLLKALSGSGILFDNGAECSYPPACQGTALTSPIVQKCLSHPAGSLADIFAGILSENQEAKATPPPAAPHQSVKRPPPPQDLSDSDADALFAALTDVLKDHQTPSPSQPPQPPPPPPAAQRPPPRPFPSEDLAAVLPKLEQTLKEILESGDAAADPPAAPHQPPPATMTTTPNLQELEKTLSALLPLLRDIVRKGGAEGATPPPAKEAGKAAALRNLLELLQRAAEDDFADVQLLMSECEDDPAKKAQRGGAREVFVNVGAIFHSHQPLCSKI